MRVPGIHVWLTAGVVAVTSIGAVTAFSLTGSSEAEQRLPSVAPPPAVAAPLDPAPLPVAPPQPPAPEPAVAAQPPADEPTRAAEPEPDRSSSGNRDAEPRERRPDPPKDRDKDRDKDKPGKDKPRADPDGTQEQKLAYACQHGFVEGKMCRGYT